MASCQPECPFHRHQPLIFDFVVRPPPAAPATMSRITPLLDRDERHFERQMRVRKHAREIHQFVEQVERLGLSRAESPTYDASPRAVELDERLAGDERFDDQHPVVRQESPDLIANRRQRSVLNLDQLSFHDDVDPVVVEHHFLAGIAGRVELFELAVERRFHVRRGVAPRGLSLALRIG